MNVTSKLFLGATLVAFTLTACAGGDDTSSSGVTGGAPEANGSASSTENPPPPAAAATPPSNAPPSSPGPGSNPPPPPARTLALQCQGSQAPTDSRVCLETAEGRAGDVLDLEVHLLRASGCGLAEYAAGSILIDPTKFELVNPDSQPDCLHREQSVSSGDPDLDSIFWQAFDHTTAPPSCTASAGTGKVDVIKVRIKPGTPAGDYDLPFESSEIIGGAGAGCSGVFLDVAGKIRVLP